MATSHLLSPGLEFALLMLSFVGTNVVEGLAALWAASSQRHWFWRALAVWGAVMLIVPLRIPTMAVVFAVTGPLIVLVMAMFRWFLRPAASAPNPEASPNHCGPGWQAFKVLSLIVFALVSAVAVGQLAPQGWLGKDDSLALLWTLVFALMIWARWQRDPPPQLTVRLRDLLLAMVIVGLALAWFRAMSSQSARGDTGECIITAAALAVPLAMAWCAAFGPHRLLAGLLCLGSAAASIFLLPEVGYLRMGWYLFCGYPEPSPFIEARIVGLFLGLVITAVLLVGWIGKVATSASAPRGRTAARCLLATISILAGVPLGWIYWQMYWTARPPRAVTGTPNHFARIVMIGHVHAAPDTSATERTALRRELAHLLAASNFIPFDQWQSLTFADREHDAKEQMQRIDDGKFLELAAAMLREAEAAANSRDFDQAADWAVSNLRLGTMLCRGGLVKHYLTGSAVRNSALHDLIQFRRNLSRQKSLEVIAALDRVTADLESPAAIEARDLLSEEDRLGWPTRLRHVVREIQRRICYPNEAIGIAPQRTFSLDFEILLQVELAIHIYEIDHGKPPSTLSSLAPKYLPAVPLDPHSSAPLKYRLHGDTFLLYSVGSDAVDDGGRFTNIDGYYQSRGYDFDAEMLTRL